MSQLVFNSLATQPSSPAAGKVTIFGLTGDKRVYMLDETGALTPLADVAGPQKNYVLNGGFTFAQRQALTTLATYTAAATARTFAHDQWAVSAENASVNIRSVDSIAATETGLLARYYAKLVKITGAGKVQYSQCIEGSAMAPLRGRTVRLSAKMRFTVAGGMTVRFGLLQLNSSGTVDTLPATFISAHGAAGTDPTFGTNLALIAPNANTAENSTISGSGLTCVLTANWVRYSASFTIPTNAVNLIPIVWSNGQLAVNDELNIAEAGMYDSADVVSTWSPPQVGDEQMQLGRFYFKTFRPGTAPVQNAGLNTGEYAWSALVAGVAQTRASAFFFPVVMRKAPTLTFFNPAALNALGRDETAGADTSATTALAITESSTLLSATGAAGTAVSNTIGVHFTAEAGL